MKIRNFPLAFVIGLTSVAAQAQPVTPAPSTAQQVDQADPRASDDDTDDSKKPITDPCYDKWRCPDPLTLDQRVSAADTHILAPGAKPPPPKKRTATRIRLVKMPDGTVRRVYYIHPVQVARGYTPPPGSAPWQVQLQRPEKVAQVQRLLDWEDRLACGGSIIAPGWVLTAAHCITDLGGPIKGRGYRIRMGLSNIESGDNGISYAVVDAIAGPDYRTADSSGDIALIRFAPDDQTAKDAAGGKRAWVQSIPIDKTMPAARPIGGKQAFFYGWGRTEKDHPSAPLQIGEVRIEPEQTCGPKDAAICARGVGPAGAAQCHGDSGGPLVVYDKLVPTLIGLVSHNQGAAACGANPLPGVYTRVAKYAGWIEGVTGKLNAPPIQLQARMLPPSAARGN